MADRNGDVYGLLVQGDVFPRGRFAARTHKDHAGRFRNGVADFLAADGGQGIGHAVQGLGGAGEGNGLRVGADGTSQAIFRFGTNKLAPDRDLFRLLLLHGHGHAQVLPVGDGDVVRADVIGEGGPAADGMLALGGDGGDIQLQRQVLSVQLHQRLPAAGELEVHAVPALVCDHEAPLGQGILPDEGDGDVPDGDGTGGVFYVDDVQPHAHG